MAGRLAPKRGGDKDRIATQLLPAIVGVKEAPGLATGCEQVGGFNGGCEGNRDDCDSDFCAKTVCGKEGCDSDNVFDKEACPRDGCKAEADLNICATEVCGGDGSANTACDEDDCAAGCCNG